MSGEVQRHYDAHLAPIYVWMVGDVAAALQRNRDFFAAAGLTPSARGVAVDLGCGFGLQAIPLAELGHEVVALDFSAELLAELRTRASRASSATKPSTSSAARALVSPLRILPSMLSSYCTSGEAAASIA